MVPMNADDVMKLIRDQTAGRESLPNSHGVELDRCRVKPAEIQVINRAVREGKLTDSIETVWLVLKENPCQNDGYLIVFSEERAMFGLASVGFASDQHPVICGYYGDFPTTLASM
jgi:hypothetical protein